MKVSHTVVLGIAGLIVFACVKSEHDANQRAEEKAAVERRLAQQQREAAAKKAAETKAGCERDRAAVTQSADAARTSRELLFSAQRLSECGHALADDALKKRGADFERRHLVLEIQDRTMTANARLNAFNRLADRYPDEAAKHGATRRALEGAIRSAELAERKSKGVSIGMTQEEVLQSSWGRPHSVNKTTTVHGTREQWVYGGRNYLYFENGILTSIQN